MSLNAYLEPVTKPSSVQAMDRKVDSLCSKICRQLWLSKLHILAEGKSSPSRRKFIITDSLAPCLTVQSLEAL